VLEVIITDNVNAFGFFQIRETLFKVLSRWLGEPKRGYRFSNLTLLQVIHPWSWVTFGIHAFTSSYCEAALLLFVTSQRHPIITLNP